MDITMIPKLYLMCVLLMNTLLMCSSMICQDGWVKLSGGGGEGRAGGAGDPNKDTTRIVPDLCIKINKTPLSWDAALDSCRTELGQLLILDNRYSDTLDMDYQIFDNIMPQVANVLFSNGITDSWTSMHLDHGKLFWEDWKPHAVIRYVQGYAWMEGEPWADSGNCVAARLNTALAMQQRAESAGDDKRGRHQYLTYRAGCSTKLPFACMAKPIKPVAEMNSYGCINDWAGSIYLNKCYKLVSSPSTASNSSLACQRLGGQLATPNSELIHSFLLSLMTERATLDQQQGKVCLQTPIGKGVWQSFSPSVTGKLVHVEIYMGHEQFVSRGEISIYRTLAENSETSSSLGSTQYSVSPGRNWQRLTFSVLVNVQENVKYSIFVTSRLYNPRGVRVDDSGVVGYCDDDPYQKGALEEESSTKDIAFKTYIIKEYSMAWIGARIKQGNGYWADGTRWTKGQGRFDKPLPPTGERCVAMELDTGAWTSKNCHRENLPYICQIKAYRIDLRPSLQRIQSSSGRALKCDAGSAYRDLPILWTKDNMYFDNPNKEDDPSVLILDSTTNPFEGWTRSHNEGWYDCEVWDIKAPVKRSVSNKILVTKEGTLIAVGSLHARGIIFDPKRHSKMNLYVMSDVSSRDSFTKPITEMFRFIRIGGASITPLVQLLQLGDDTEIGMRVHFRLFLNREQVSRDLAYSDDELLAVLLSKMKTVAAQEQVWRQQFAVWATDPQSITLRSTVQCSSVQLKTLNGRPARLPAAPVSSKVKSSEMCLGDGRPLAQATCTGDVTLGASWEGIEMFNDCREPESQVTSELRSLSKTEISELNVARMAEVMESLTANPNILTHADIVYTSQVLQSIAVVPRKKPKVLTKIVETVSNLMQADGGTLRDAQRIAGSSNRIIQALEQSSHTADLLGEENLRVVDTGLALEIWDITNQTNPVIGFNSNSKQAGSNVGSLYGSEVSYKDTETAIILPRSLLLSKRTQSNKPTRISFSLYRTTQLFTPALKSNTTNQSENVTISHVISASIKGREIKGLKTPVKIIFKPQQPLHQVGEKHCVYWDFHANNGTGAWSSAGCRYAGQKDGRDICLCDHLTNFAILMDVYGQSRPLSAEHDMVLSIISKVGLALSILGLTATILTYLVFRKLRKGRSQHTLFNLAIALLVAMVVFLAGVERTENLIGCIIVAVILHYFILAAFLWMLMEAILQYLMFVKVMGTYIPGFMLKTCLLAWGLPLLPVTIVLILDYNMYNGGDRYCWMHSTAFYFAFMVPVCTIIIINAIIFVTVIRSITCGRDQGLKSSQSERSLRKVQVQAGVCCFVVLGLTWIFGFLAVEDAQLVFQYLFCIFNSIQGLLIFIFHVLRDRQVRQHWCGLCFPGLHRPRDSYRSTSITSVSSSTSAKAAQVSRNTNGSFS